MFGRSKTLTSVCAVIFLIGCGLLFYSIFHTPADVTAFTEAFACSPDRPQVAQEAVTNVLRSLLDEACETAKQWQVFPTDNYALECRYDSLHTRLNTLDSLARRLGFTPPPEIERYRSHARWDPHATYAELECY